MDNKTLKAKANATALMLIAHSSDTEDWEILLRPVCIGMSGLEVIKFMLMIHVYYCFHTGCYTREESIERIEKIEKDFLEGRV